MTFNEFVAIREFYGKHADIKPSGHVWLFPKAIKHIKKPSDTLQRWAQKNQVLYLNPKTMRVNGENLRILDQWSGSIEIHHRWIQSVLLYHYNF